MRTIEDLCEQYEGVHPNDYEQAHARAEQATVVIRVADSEAIIQKYIARLSGDELNIYAGDIDDVGFEYHKDISETVRERYPEILVEGVIIGGGYIDSETVKDHSTDYGSLPQSVVENIANALTQEFGQEYTAGQVEEAKPEFWSK